MATWIVLQRKDSRYNDELGVAYEYPSHIANGSQIAVDDIVIVVEPKKVNRRYAKIIGWGAIGYIHKRPYFDKKKNKWRTMHMGVYNYYNEVVGGLSYEDIGGDPRNNQQNAIVRIPEQRAQSILNILGAASAKPHNYEPAEEQLLLPFAEEAPIELPEEQWQARKIRQGQTMFRKNMLVLYGAQCAVSGYTPNEVLDAAHIIPYAESEDHDLGNGLLLRSDLHNLFDDGLLRINPDSMVVELSRQLIKSPYQELHGQVLRERVDGTHPSLDALDQHYRAYRTQ
ncbi:MAG: HNH endonuclease [Flavobacteriales bacterium]